MAAVDLDGLINDIFADRAGLHMKPYRAEDRDAEAAKIARLRQLRMAQNAGTSKKVPSRLIVTR